LDWLKFGSDKVSEIIRENPLNIWTFWEFNLKNYEESLFLFFLARAVYFSETNMSENTAWMEKAALFFQNLPIQRKVTIILHGFVFLLSQSVFENWMNQIQRKDKSAKFQLWRWVLVKDKTPLEHFVMKMISKKSEFTQTTRSKFFGFAKKNTARPLDGRLLFSQKISI